MGRPINKKFFGNLTSPYDNAQTGGTTGTGGEGVASIAVSGTNNGYTEVPALTISNPQLPKGVKPTVAVHMEVAGVTNFLNGDGYAPEQILTLQETGAVGTAGTLRVLTTEVSTVAIGAAGAGGWTEGDTVVTVATGTGTAATVTVTADAGGVVTGVAIATRGSYTVNPTLDNVAVTGGPGGNGGGLLLDLTMRIGTVEVATAGDYTALPADVTRFSVTTGTADFNLTFKVKSVAVLTAGSGYSAAPTVTDTGNADFTATLTSSNPNAIAFTSYLTTGTQAVTGGDIMKQEASRRYLVNNSEGIGQVKLVAKDDLAAGQMNLIATDGAGSTFYVTKLTARKATVIGRTGTSTAVVTSGASVGWTLGVATGTTQVTLASN